MAGDRSVELEITGRSEGLKKAAVEARTEVDRLARELDELKASGNATNDELAESEARLEEATRAYKDAADAAGKFAASQREAAEDIKRTAQQTQGFGGNIRSLDQAIDVHIPKLGKFLGTVGLAAKTFDYFYDGTRKVIDGLKGFGLDLDASTQKLFRFDEGNEDAAAAALELANAQNILRKAFHESAATLEEARAKLDKFARAKAEAAAATKAESEALFGNEEALKKSTAALLASIKAEGDLTEAQKEIVKKALQEKAEAYEAAGLQIDAALKAEMEARGILSKSAEEDAKKFADAAAKRAKAEEDAAARTAVALEKEAEARKKALAEAEAGYGKAIQDATKDGGGARMDPELARRADEAQGKVDDLKGKIEELESLDFLTPEQVSQLDSMKSQLGGASRAAEEFAQRANLGTTAVIDQAEAVDLLGENQKVLDAIWAEQAANHQKVLDQLADEEKRYDSNAEAAEDFAGRLEEGTGKVADSFDDMGKAAEQGGKKVEESLAEQTKNAESLYGWLVKIRAILPEIREEAAGISL